MSNVLILMGGIAVVVWIVALADWWARRGGQQPHH